VPAPDGDPGFAGMTKLRYLIAGVIITGIANHSTCGRKALKKNDALFESETREKNSLGVNGVGHKVSKPRYLTTCRKRFQ
jgi:hypothetical protein